MSQMTIGELKKALEEYPNDAVIYMEPQNAYTKGKKSTAFSQRAKYFYSCKEHMTKNKALMIVGSML